jgi:hypothetical protein
MGMAKRKQSHGGNPAEQQEPARDSLAPAEARALNVAFTEALTDDDFLNSLMTFGLSEAEAQNTIANRL